MAEDYNTDVASAFIIHLTQKTSERLTTFFERPEFLDKPTSYVIDVLLDLAESHPDAQVYRYRLSPLKKVPYFSEKGREKMTSKTATSRDFLRRKQPGITYGDGSDSDGENTMDSDEENEEADRSILNNTISKITETVCYGNNEDIGSYVEISGADAVPRENYRQEKLVETPVVTTTAMVKSDGRQIVKEKESAPKFRKKNFGRGDAKRSIISSTAGHFCYSIILKRQRNNKVQCRLCEQWLIVKPKRGWIRCRIPFNHVCNHFGKNLFGCRICSYRTTNESRILTHISGVHKASGKHLMDEFVEGNEKELKELVEKCFDWEFTQDPPDIPPGQRLLKKKGDEVILRKKFEKDALRSFVGAFIPKWQVNGALYCRVCDKWIRVAGYTHNFRVQNVLDHIFRHINKPLFQCNLCPRRAISVGQIRSHLKNAHQSTTGNFTEEPLASMEQELKTMALRCFDRSSDNDMRPENDGQYNRDIERLAFFRYFQAVASTNVKDNYLACRLCGRFFEISSKLQKNSAALDHAMGHTNLDIFSCRKCPQVHPKRETMQTHIRKKHKGTPYSSFDDHSVMFREEIFSMIHKCFDATYNNENVDDFTVNPENNGQAKPTENVDASSIGEEFQAEKEPEATVE